MFHLVSYKWFRRTLYNINRLVLQEVGRLWRVSDCEELVGPITISSTIKNPITEGL